MVFSNYEDYFMGILDNANRSLAKLFNFSLDSNEIRISDFIANTRDRRLLSLIRNKYKECFNSNFSSDDFENFEYGDIDIEYLDFNISPKGTIMGAC